MATEPFTASPELPSHLDVNNNAFSAPTPQSHSTTTATDLQSSLINNSKMAANAVKDHPIVQSALNGPVANSVSKETKLTKDEFSDLAGSRNAPVGTAVNETELTKMHSLFYNLLSWKNKRATGITFASVIAFIFAARYLPVVRYVIKFTWMSLGVVTVAEASSKALMGTSVATSIRPRRYYKIPKEALEASLDDLENLINFFVIEIQRIVFAENIPVTAAAFVTAFLTYYLIKIVPFWGMALIATSVIFLGPLIYIENKEFIDGHLEHAGNVIGQQTSQIKDLTAQHTSKGLESMKQYTGSAAAKAQDLVGTARQKIPSPTTSKASVKDTDFPSAPKADLPETKTEALPHETEPIPAS